MRGVHVASYLHVSAQKQACFHVFSSFSASFYSPLHHNGKGSTPTIFLLPLIIHVVYAFVDRIARFLNIYPKT